MILDSLTRSLRVFAGTDFAQAAMSRTLPPDFSRAGLLEELETIRASLPETPLRDRMFGEPGSLRSAAESRIREWEISRTALVAAVRGLESQGLDFSRQASGVRVTFSHSNGVALALAAAFTRPGGLGVDLEREGREVSPAAFARYHRREELAFLEDPLDHWVLKEAAFKAHPRSAETIVADYAVVGRGPAEGEFTLECGKGKREHFRCVLGSIDGHRYAFAIPSL